jgi:hypothetical protein
MRGIFISGCLLAWILAAGCASTDSKNEVKAPPAVAETKPAAAIHDDDTVHVYVDDIRADLSDGKIVIINDVMKLTDAEDKVFWPIYADYEQELFDLGDKRLDLMGEFVAAQDHHALSEAKAADLTANFFQLEQDRLDLVRKYNGILSKELSPIRAAQFTQIEHRIATVVDLMVASQMPLVQHRLPGDGQTSAAPATQESAPSR